MKLFAILLAYVVICFHFTIFVVLGTTVLGNYDLPFQL